MIAGAVWALATGSWSHQLPERDAGVFLYVGERLLAGDVLYVDVWDHKPPLVYWLHALALLVTGQPVLASRLLEAAALVVAAVLGFALLERWLDRRAALFGTLAWVLASAPLLEAGNGIIEVLALPLQFGALWLFAVPGRQSARDWLASGAFLGLSLLLKPTLGGTWIAIAIAACLPALVRRDLRNAVRPLLPLTIGLAGVVAVAFALVVPIGALPAAIDSLVVYNAWYAATGWSERAASLMRGIALLLTPGLAPLAGVGWLLGAAQRMRGTVRAPVRPLLTVALLALPIELVLSSLAGRDYPHYYIAWLPAFGLLAAYAYQHGTAAILRGARLESPLRGIPVAIALVWLLAVDARVGLGAVDFQGSGEMTSRLGSVAYVRDHTPPGDGVIVWGAEAIVNAVTSRRAPGRFSYIYPLYTRGYQSADLVAEFLRGLDADPPVLIIDASRAADGQVAPLDAAAAVGWSSARRGYAEIPEIAAIRAWVAARYVPVATSGGDRWTIYRRNASQ